MVHVTILKIHGEMVPYYTHTGTGFFGLSLGESFHGWFFFELTFSQLMEEGATVGLGLELIISSGVSSPSRVAWTPALAASPPTSDPWLRIAAAPAAVFSAFMY